MTFDGAPAASGGDEQLGQEQRPEDVGGEGQLVAVDAGLALLGQDAGVVDEGGDAAGRAPRREPAPSARTDASEERSHRWRWSSSLPVASLIRARASGAALEVADDHVDAGAERGELLGRGGADARSSRR